MGQQEVTNVGDAGQYMLVLYVLGMDVSIASTASKYKTTYKLDVLCFPPLHTTKRSSRAKGYVTAQVVERDDTNAANLPLLY